MPSKSVLAKLEADLAVLESAKAEEDTRATARWLGYDMDMLRTWLEAVMVPATLAEAGVEPDQRDPELRTYLWGWWEALKLLSRIGQHTHFPKVDAVAAQVSAGIEAWIDRLLAVAKAAQLPDNAPCDLPAWNPLNPVSLLAIRYRVRLDGPSYDSHPAAREKWFGAFTAEPVEPSLTAAGLPPPWDQAFPADPDAWPAEVRALVEKCGCLPPAEVPLFDWKDVPSYRHMHPFERDREGSPLPGAFEKWAAAGEERREGDQDDEKDD